MRGEGTPPSLWGRRGPPARASFLESKIRDEAFDAVEAGHFGPAGDGEAFEEEAAVGFLDDAGVEEGDHAAVGRAADEAADALAEFHEGVGERDFVEGMAAFFADPFAAGFDDGVGGDFEGEARDDDLGKGVAGDVDAGPKAVGAEEHAVASGAEEAGEFGAGGVAALHEEGAAGAFVDGFEALGDAFHVGVAGEEHEGAATGAAGAEIDVIDEGVEGKGGSLARGRRNIGRDEDAHVAGVVERRGFDAGAEVVAADALLEGLDRAAEGEGGAGADDGGAAAEELVAEVGGDVDGGGAEGDDGLAAAGALEPEDEFLGFGEGEELVEGGLGGFDALGLVLEFVAGGAFFDLVGEFGEGAVEGGEGAVEGGLGAIGLADADDGVVGEEVLLEEAEKEVGGVEGVVHELEDDGGGFEAGEEAALGARVVEVFQHAIHAVAAEAQAEVIGGDGGDGVGFVDDNKVVGEEDAAGFGSAGGAGGVEEGEEEGVVDDDDVGVADAGAGTLVEAVGGVAVFAGAAGGVGVDEFPDVGRGRGIKFVAEAFGGGGGPVGDAVEFGLFGGAEEVLFIAESGGEAGGAAVVALTEEDGGFEIGVGFGVGVGGKNAAAEGEVFAVNLFLEGDGVGGDDELAGLIDGVDDAREEVGEGFADAGAGFKEEGFVVGHGGGDGAGHGFLLGAVFELKGGSENAVGRKERGRHGGGARRGRRRGEGVVFVAQADHGARQGSARGGRAQ